MTRPRIGVRHAVRGVATALRQQGNLRIELAVAVAAVATTLWLQAPLAPIVLVCGLVLCCELLNTAIEAVVDLVSPEAHPLAAQAKDVAAGAVLVATAIAVVTGLAHLGPPLLERLTRGTP
ncbi:MAG: diacylglycerol kinase family protein [Trueperaceae bacterium]